jgi:hypothetical protein
MRTSRRLSRGECALACATLVGVLTAAMGSACEHVARADTVVQLPVDVLLNARPVSTLIGGKVIAWTAGQGIDADDGLITSSAEAALGQTGVALPDDGTFGADADHPDIVLHFADSAPASSFQAYELSAAGHFAFAVPPGAYSKVYLLMTSSYGACTLTVTMMYADGSSSPVTFALPDWGTGQPLPTSPPIFFNLISGMHKWTSQDQQTDAPVHTVTGVVLSADGTKELTGLQVSKPGAAQTLVFWGATGLASLAIDAAMEADGAAAVDASAIDATDSSSGSMTGELDDARGAVVAESADEEPSGDASAGLSGSGGSSPPDSGASSGILGAGREASASSGAPESASDAGAAASAGGCSMSARPLSPAHLWSVLVALSAGALRRRGRLRRSRNANRGRQGGIGGPPCRPHIFRRGRRMAMSLGSVRDREIRSTGVDPLRSFLVLCASCLACGACTSKELPIPYTSGSDIDSSAPPDSASAAGGAMALSGSSSGNSGASSGASGSSFGPSGSSAGGSGASAGSSSGTVSSGSMAATGSTSSEGGAQEASTEASAPCSASLGYAMQFQSQHPDLLQANIPNLPVGTASRTIELWAYFDGTGNSWLNEHGLFETGDRQGNGNECHEFALNSTAITGNLSDGNGRQMLHPYGNCNPVDDFFNVPAGTLMNDSGWMHISFAYDLASNQFQFTINGSAMLSIGTGNGAAGRTHPEGNWPEQGWGTTSYTPQDAANFGTNNPGGNLLSIGTTPQFAGPTGWGGKIDEFRVWSTFRDADTIKANMYTIMNGQEPGLVAYYKFDEGSGMTVHDSTQPADSSTNAAVMTPWNGANPPLTPPTWVMSDIPGTFTCE